MAIQFDDPQKTGMSLYNQYMVQAGAIAPVNTASEVSPRYSGVKGLGATADSITSAKDGNFNLPTYVGTHADTINTLGRISTAMSIQEMLSGAATAANQDIAQILQAVQATYGSPSA